MKKKKNNVLIFIGLILGIVLGIYLPKFAQKISFIGVIYINLLKFMIVPIILTTIITTVYKSKKLNNKMILKAVVMFITMFIITFLITSTIVYFIKPGINFNFNYVEWKDDSIELNYSDIIINLFPSNIINIFQSNLIFQCIVFAIFFAVAAFKTNGAEIVIDLIDKIREILFKLLDFIMYLTPIGVFSLVSTSIANYGKSIIGIGIKYIGVAYFCSIIILIIVMILPVWILRGINPFKYIKRIFNVWVMTFTTCSSVATLPTTIKTCTNEFKLPSSTTNIIVPLGCTIHMCGGAVSFALLGLFCSQLFGIAVTPILFVKMLISAVLINMAAPGIPNGGIVIGATYLALLGIPIEFIGLYSGIYKILDMIYTTLNVTGDITANVLLTGKEKI